MASSTWRTLYEVIIDRQVEKAEGSYTCYLFEKGKDKILKKCVFFYYFEMSGRNFHEMGSCRIQLYFNHNDFFLVDELTRYE